MNNIPLFTIIYSFNLNIFNYLRKYYDEMKKTKELNLTYNNKGLQENIQEILTTKQKLTQTKTEVQHNLNETIKLKNNVQLVNNSFLFLESNEI